MFNQSLSSSHASLNKDLNVGLDYQNDLIKIMKAQEVQR